MSQQQCTSRTMQMLHVPDPMIHVYTCKSIVLFEECRVPSVGDRPHKCSATRKCAKRQRKFSTNEPYFEISTPPVAPRIYGIVSHVTQGSSGLAYSLDITVDGELTSSQGSDHEKTSTETTKAAPQAEFFCDLDQAAGGAFTWQTLCLVDL